MGLQHSAWPMAEADDVQLRTATRVQWARPISVLHMVEAGVALTRNAHIVPKEQLHTASDMVEEGVVQLLDATSLPFQKHPIALPVAVERDVQSRGASKAQWVQVNFARPMEADEDVLIQADVTSLHKVQRFCAFYMVVVSDARIQGVQRVL